MTSFTMIIWAIKFQYILNSRGAASLIIPIHISWALTQKLACSNGSVHTLGSQ